MWAVRMLIVIVLVLLAIGFGIQNAGERVTAVKIFKTTYLDVPMIWVVFLAFVVGMIACFFIAVTYYFKISAAARAERREVRRLQAEITALRNRPLEKVEIEEPEEE